MASSGRIFRGVFGVSKPLWRYHLDTGVFMTVSGTARMFYEVFMLAKEKDKGPDFDLLEGRLGCFLGGITRYCTFKWTLGPRKTF